MRLGNTTGVTAHLDQIDETLKAYAADPAAAAVLGAAESLRLATQFIDVSVAKVDEIMKAKQEAIATAADVARGSVAKTGFNSAADREAVVAKAGESIADAFYRKAVLEVAERRQKKADELATDAIDSLAKAKLKIAQGYAKAAEPLAFRMSLTPTTKAQIDALAVELAADKPSAIEQLIKTFKAVEDDDRVAMILVAITPLVRSYLDDRARFERFRGAGNPEVEAAAVNRLKVLIDDLRKAAVPQSLVEAEAGQRRLLALFGAIFGKRATPDAIAAAPNWLEMALGKPSRAIGSAR